MLPLPQVVSSVAARLKDGTKSKNLKSKKKHTLQMELLRSAGSWLHNCTVPQLLHPFAFPSFHALLFLPLVVLEGALGTPCRSLLV